MDFIKKFLDGIKTENQDIKEDCKDVEIQTKKEMEIKEFISPTTQTAKKKLNDLLRSFESNGVDPYFIEAGKFIIEKDKASIGMIQRVFKIGFNRSARIMD